MALSVSLFVVVTLAVQVLSSTLPVALAFGLMAAYLPFAALTGRVSRQLELAEVWPDAVDNLASAVRAGMSLAEAVSGLAVRGPEPLRPSFDVLTPEGAAPHQPAESSRLCSDALGCRRRGRGRCIQSAGRGVDRYGAGRS